MLVAEIGLNGETKIIEAMKTPIELLRQELTILKFTASGRYGMTEKKREAKRLIPIYEAALELLAEAEKSTRASG